MPGRSPYEEKNLLLLISRGDEDAFRDLYDQNWQNIYGMALTYTKSVSEAQDLVQELFTNIWEKRDRLPEAGSPSNYIFIAARNLVISALRKKAVRSVPGEIDSDEHQLLPDNFLLPDSPIIVKQLEAAIEKAIETLTSQQRQIFRLSRNEGMSHEQIAEKLGINRYTVKNHIVAALNALRLQLTREEMLVILPMFILCM